MAQQTGHQNATTIDPGAGASTPAPPGEGAPARLGERVGEYELLGHLGRGGMGEVYRVRHLGTGEVVALKLLKGGGQPSPAVLRSARREIEAAGRLVHPGILPIRQVGEHQGAPFYTMPLVEGGTLGDRMRAGLSLREGVAVLAAVARAAHFAHRKGVVHRDLKPGNVLMGEGGEPLLADFGLARFDDGRSAYTMTGDLLGSPHYMSPEQAAGLSHKATATTDVWALGVMLYEVLAGERPFEGEKLSVLRRIQLDEPIAPRRLRGGVPADLEAVCLRCLHKRQKDRYPSAGHLADDLQRWLDRGSLGEDAAAPRPDAVRPALRPMAALGLAALLLFAAMVGLVPPSQADKRFDPDEQARASLRALLAEARPDKPVDLLVEGRKPRYAVFALNGKSSLLTIAPGQPAWLHSPTNCLLELIPPDPDRGDYRLVLEMAQTDGEGISQVGAYVGYRHRPGANGRAVHGFTQATYCEPRYEARQLPQPDLSLALAWFYEQPNDATLPHRYAPAARLTLPAVVPTVKGEEFRTFWIEVCSGKVTIGVPGAPARTASRGDLELAFRHLGRKSPELNGYSFDVSPCGGAGLVIWRGSVVIRRVSYEPLPPLR